MLRAQPTRMGSSGSGSAPPDRHRCPSVRYYVDADLMGLAKVLANLREDITYPSDPGGAVRKRMRPVSPVTSTEVDDLDWIPIVAERGWSILTRDMKITRRPAELEAVRAHSAKLFVRDSREDRERHRPALLCGT